MGFRTYAWLLFVCWLAPHGRAEQELSSPGYPAPYPPSQKKVWNLSVQQGKRVRLQFTHFDVGEDDGYCQDYVKVIDGGRPLVTACGALSSAPGDIPEPLEFVSASNTLTVQFSSRPVQNRHFRGFHAVYTALGFDECAHTAPTCAHYCHSQPGGLFCSCAHGYTLGADQTSCQETDLLCSPEVPINATREPKREIYKAGEEVTVTCQEGYEDVMEDESSQTSYRSTCQKDGQWSQFHHCQLMDCGPPEEIENGKLLYLSGADVTTYGATVLYNCTAPYYELTPKGDGVYRCSSSAEWTNTVGDTRVPECTPVCGFPSAPIKGAERVIKGKPAVKGSFPWQIYFHPLGAGGGALISDQWILTAAHVVEDNIGSIFAGLLIVSDINVQSSTALTVEKTIIHPNYKKGQNPITDFDNDLALVKLAKKVPLGPTISPICLPGRDSTYIMKEDQIGYISGWGLTEKNITARHLRMASIPVVNMDLCRNVDVKNEYKHTDNMICAGGSGRDSCTGDSGGAYVSEDPNNKEMYYVGGIISWGIKCGKYGVYTKISNYLDWVEETMKNNRDS